MNSIRRWLLGWLICGLALVSTVAGFAIFHTARNEAAELFDYELRAIALSLPRAVATTDLASQPDGVLEGLSDDRIVIQTWRADGRPIYGLPEDETLPRQSPGFQTIEHDERRWRVYGLVQSDRFIQVAQPVSVRNALGFQLAARTLWPLALLLPGAVILVLIVVSRGLRPVHALSVELAKRSAEVLDPIEPGRHVPVELRPLVDGLNDLLARLDLALQGQRTFVADAAHELRSPLTALKLQLQLAVRNGTVNGDPEVLAKLDERLKRTIHLVNQLLTMAREDAAVPAPMASFDLHALAAQIVADASILAEEKQLDLGLEPSGLTSQATLCMVVGDPHAFGVLLGNLVDNAIRYTPGGGKVDVLIGQSSEGVWIEVADNGPGVPEHELERLFDRFYRGEQASALGSGLGLAIARQVALRHRAVLTLRRVSEQGGLAVRVTGIRVARRLPHLDVNPPSPLPASHTNRSARRSDG
jgi:two-component system, OmpR family, sensor kinase